MGKEIFVLNDLQSMYSKDNINNLIIEINKLKITKDMKKLLLVASLNLISSIKTTKSLVYQLETFKNQGKIIPTKTKSKYINNILKDFRTMSVSDFSNNINNLINFLKCNNINIKI